MDRIHHIALETPKLGETVEWYRNHFDCAVRHRDASWALLAFDNILLALVRPGDHPPHLAFVRDDANDFGELTPHRDGTRSCYVRDGGGNAVEFIDAASVNALGSSGDVLAASEGAQ